MMYDEDKKWVIVGYGLNSCSDDFGDLPSLLCTIFTGHIDKVQHLLWFLSLAPLRRSVRGGDVQYTFFS